VLKRVLLRNFPVTQLDLQFSVVYPPPSERSQGYLEERTALQFFEETGATRRIRTADLLITKNSQPTAKINQSEKSQRKKGS
jgi:hypothetical protein